MHIFALIRRGADSIQWHARTSMRAFARFSFKCSTSDYPPPPIPPSGRKFEKKIQNLLLVISMSGGAWLLSIAPFFQPFDILFDVVCVKVQPRHILFIISEGRKTGKGGVGLLIERVRSCCTQTPHKHCAEFPQVPNVSNYSKFPKQRSTEGFFCFCLRAAIESQPRFYW